MSSSLDMSLEDLSKRGGASRGGRGGRGGSAPRGGRDGGAGPMRNKPQRNGGGGASEQRAPRQQQPYARAPVQYAPVAYVSAEAGGAQWKHDLYEAPAPAPQPQQPVKKISGDTIHVSNLAPDVSDDDVREIFERIGAVKSCVVNFNSAGKSTGTATVTFHKKNDAEKAVEDYDEAEVDGRPMKLKLIGSVVSAPVVVKKTKPAAPVIVQQALPQLAYMPQLGFQQPLQYAPSYQQAPRVKQQQQQQQAPARGGATRGGRGGRGGAASAASAPARGGAKAARAPRAAPKEVSGADLDKEMDAYHSAKAAPAADAAPAAGQPTNA